jgi:hypothetical protein
MLARRLYRVRPESPQEKNPRSARGPESYRVLVGAGPPRARPPAQAHS